MNFHRSQSSDAGNLQGKRPLLCVIEPHMSSSKLTPSITNPDSRLLNPMAPESVFEAIRHHLPLAMLKHTHPLSSYIPYNAVFFSMQSPSSSSPSHLLAVQPVLQTQDVTVFYHCRDFVAFRCSPLFARVGHPNLYRPLPFLSDT